MFSVPHVRDQRLQTLRCHGLQVDREGFGRSAERQHRGGGREGIPQRSQKDRQEGRSPTGAHPCACVVCGVTTCRHLMGCGQALSHSGLLLPPSEAPSVPVEVRTLFPYFPPFSSGPGTLAALCRPSVTPVPCLPTIPSLTEPFFSFLFVSRDMLRNTLIPPR